MAYADDLARLQRQRSLTQALIQQSSQPQGMQAGRVFVGPTPLSGLASLAGIVAGGVMENKLGKQEKTLKDQRRAQLADALRGLVPQPPTSAPTQANGTPPIAGATPPINPQSNQALQILQSLPMEQQEALVGQQALAKLFPKPPEEYTLGQGETRFRGNQKIAEGTPKPIEPVAKIQEYQQAVKDGFKGSFLDYQMALMKAGREPKENNTYRPMTPDEISAAGLPPGTSAQIDNNGKIDVLSKRDNSGALSQKDQTTAKMKLNTIKLARQQLSNIRDKFLGPQDPNTGIRDAGKGIKGGISAGPFGQGRLPTEGGQSFDRAVDQMRSTLTALTRVPGVGAMSDYETRLDQAKFPSRINYESVTEDQIDQLDNMLNAIESGYSDLLSKSQPEMQAQPQNGVQPRATQPDVQTRARSYYNK